MKIINYIKKDWPLLPISVFLTAGFIIPFIELDFIEKQDFHYLLKGLGLGLLVVGAFIALLVRLELVKKAKFPGVQSTKFLQIVKGHRLITNGMFKYIRHPLYFGFALMSYGWVIMFSSLYGILLITISMLFLLPRMKIEEEMLLENFGNEYRDYQKKTKKIIPFIY